MTHAGRDMVVGCWVYAVIVGGKIWKMEKTGEKKKDYVGQDKDKRLLR